MINLTIIVATILTIIVDSSSSVNGQVYRDNNYRPSIHNAEENLLPHPATVEDNYQPSNNNIDDPSEEKTGSPFDFLNDVLENEHDLNNTRAALDSPHSRDVINDNGPNMTIFAPTDDAFNTSPKDWPEDKKKEFLDNHAIIGERIPIYRSNNYEPTYKEDRTNVLKPNIYRGSSPLIHKIDRLQHEPINPMTIMSMQPILSMIGRLVKMTKMQPKLRQPGTFFCPFDNPVTRNIVRNANPKNLKQVKEFLSDHMVPGKQQKQGCHRGMRNRNGQIIDCEETDHNTIRINDQKEFPKRQIKTPIGVIFIIDDIIFDDAPYMNELLPQTVAPPLSLVPRIFVTLRLVPIKLYDNLNKNNTTPTAIEGPAETSNNDDEHVRLERQNRLPPPAQVLRQAKNRRPQPQQPRNQPLLQQEQQKLEDIPDESEYQPQQQSPPPRKTKTKSPSNGSKSPKKPQKPSPNDQDQSNQKAPQYPKKGKKPNGKNKGQKSPVQNRPKPEESDPQQTIDDEQPEPQQEEPQQEEEEPKEEGEPKEEEPKEEEPKEDEPKEEEPKDEEPKEDEPKEDEPKEDEPKEDEPKEDEPKEDEPKEDEPKEDEPKEDEPKEDEPKEDEPKEDEPKEDEPKEDEPKEDEPKEDEPKEDEPKEDEPKEDEPKEEEPSDEQPEEGGEEDADELQQQPQESQQEEAPEEDDSQQQEQEPQQQEEEGEQAAPQPPPAPTKSKKPKGQSPTKNRRPQSQQPEDQDDSAQQAPAKKKNGKPNGQPRKSPAAAGRRPQQPPSPQEQEPEQLEQEQSYGPVQQMKDYDDPFEQKPEDYPAFEPQQKIEPNDPDDFDEMQQLMTKSARQLRCARFVDWLMNSGVMDQILEKAKEFNVTLFAPEDNAVSQLPFNMLNSMQQQPKRNADLMLMHAVPQAFDHIYPATASNYHSPIGSQLYDPFAPIETMQPGRQIRFDRSLMPSPITGEYEPLVSGCPLRNSHQIGPIRMVSTGSVLFPPQQSIYSVIKRSPNLRLCREIVDQAQMGPKLSKIDNSYTMFTPNDDAIRRRLSPRQINSLIRNPDRCRRFVDSHLVANRAIYRNSIPLTPKEQINPSFYGRQTDVPSLFENEPLRIRRSAQSFYVNDKHVQYADITTKNGVVHILNDYI